MKRPELMKQLKERNIQFNVKMKNEELKKLLVDFQVKVATDSILNKPTTDEIISHVVSRDDGEAVTKGGLIIPQNVLAVMKPTQYRYEALIYESEAEVIKIDYKGKEIHVRTYTRSMHGDDFVELAKMFVDKNNRK